MAELTLTHVKKIYPGAVTAVADFNLHVEQGEFIVLVGPSGCGKSTVLRMIAGLEQITGGEIRIDGRAVNRVPPQDRDIAMVFQNYALYPHMSVYDNMAFSLKMHRTPRAEIRNRVEETARQLEITKLLKRKPNALSGGQCQRVALGRAMVRCPAIFLLDEPLSNLDAKLRTSMRTEISALHRRIEGTFVYVTHDQTEAMTMGTRIVVMKDGLVQQADTPKQIYEHPENLFVAGFMGSPQMNFLPATLRRRDSQYAVCIGNRSIPLPGGRVFRNSLEPYADGELTIGIRPEHLYVAGEDGKDALEARVILAELMGAETYLHLDLDGIRLVVRTPPQEFSPGSMVPLRVDAARMHLFDPLTEKVIS